MLQMNSTGTNPAAPARKKEMPLRRHLALLGGTVSLADCLSVLPYLVNPSRLVHGPAIAEYEKAFARTVGVAHGSSFCAARVGFYGLLQSLGVGAGDEVLLQVPTHVVVANAVRYTGAKPVFVDCLPGNYNIDLVDAGRKVTSRTKVLLIQHSFGIPVDMDEALAFSRRHNLVVLEDCVHALGAKFGGRNIGTFGSAAFFSTEETKVISTTMGGMVVTDDATLALKLRIFQEKCSAPEPSLTFRYLLKLLMYFGLAHPYIHYYTRAVYEACGNRLPLPRPTSGDELLGKKPPHYEQLFSNAQAAVGLRQLQRLEENVSHRRMIADLYIRELKRMGVSVVAAPEGSEPVYVRFPVEVADPARFQRLAAPQLVVGNWFDTVLQEAVDPRSCDYVPGSCPNAEWAAGHLVNFPTHPRVTPEDAVRIVSLLKGQPVPGRRATTSAASGSPAG
jgi:perosamine synthetase